MFNKKIMDIIAFLILYVILSIILLILFFFLKKFIFGRLWLGIPFILASIIIFPVFLIISGYYLRILDEHREERMNQKNWYDQDNKSYNPGHSTGKVGR